MPSGTMGCSSVVAAPGGWPCGYARTIRRDDDDHGQALIVPGRGHHFFQTRERERASRSHAWVAICTASHGEPSGGV